MKVARAVVRTFAVAGLVVLIWPSSSKAQTPSANVSVFATGLNNPRGLKFGLDGELYVAEGGAAGTLSTIGVCDQVPAPVGPYTGGFTSSISKIDRHGNVSTVIDNLPSSETSAAQGNLVSGVSDIAFIGDDMYAITAGAGCSHGLVHTDNGVYRVFPDGKWKMIADLSAFQKANPVAHPNPPDFEPDGTWYSMVSVRGNLYAVEPNHGELDEISPWGEIRRIADISASQGHIVPTAVAYHGDFFVGNLGLFPIVEGSSKILRITASGHVTTVITGLTTVLGVAFDREGFLYILENTTGNPFPTAGTGEVLRVAKDGLEEIATGLSLPTAMTFGPDGVLYVSNVGFGPPPVGLGQIVKITVPRSSECKKVAGATVSNLDN
jgi:sugar lactone lactonase YvrE